jgi:hypothetical protein
MGGYLIKPRHRLPSFANAEHRDSAAAVACSLLAAARSSYSRPVQMVPPVRF